MKMGRPGPNASRSIAADSKDRTEVIDEPAVALQARDGIERVSIETVHVGDYVFLGQSFARLVDARCVIAKCAMTNERTARIVGWLLELTGGELAWWPRGSQVWRHRIDSEGARSTRYREPRDPDDPSRASQAVL
jgi:hypothetical protein